MPLPGAAPHAHAEPLAAADPAAAGPARRKRYDWARLLARVFAIDVLTCATCGAAGMQRLAFVTRPAAIRAILESVGLAADSPAPAPSRLGEQAGDVRRGVMTRHVPRSSARCLRTQRRAEVCLEAGAQTSRRTSGHLQHGALG